MNSELSAELLSRINADLQSRMQASTLAVPSAPKPIPPSPAILQLIVPETPQEIYKVRSALAVLPSDVPRGNGALYTPGSLTPAAEYWLLVIWAIASLGWRSGKELARAWSVKSARYTDDGLDAAWNSYDASLPNPIRIGSLYKLATHHGWRTPPSRSEAVAESARFRLLSAPEVLSRPPQTWRVKNLLPDRGLAAIFGPSGSGKSFLALNLAACVADGKSWFGLKTYQAPVVYIMLEGEGGLRNRIAAQELASGLPLSASFSFVLEPFSLITDRDVADLAAVVPTGAVVFLDTLNRAAPTVDENSSKEMGQILEGAKRLQTQTGGLVIIVHHTGKDPSKGMRGHSSLHAALDAAIEVERSAAGKRTWTVAKAKDGEDGKRISFKLERCVLGSDADGDEISSCSVAPDNTGIYVREEPQGQRQKTALKAIKAALASSQAQTPAIAGCPSGTKCLKVEDAVLLVAGALTTTAPNKRSHAARHILGSLSGGSYLMTGMDASQEAWCWLD